MKRVVVSPGEPRVSAGGDLCVFRPGPETRVGTQAGQKSFGSGSRLNLFWALCRSWEGMDFWNNREAGIHLEEMRTQSFRRQRQVIEQGKSKGDFPEDIDAAFASLLLSFAALGPAAFPQITKMVTGLEPDDPAVQNGINDVLEKLIERAVSAHASSSPSQ